MTKRHRARPVGAAERLPRPGDTLPEDVDALHLLTPKKVENLLARGVTVDELVAASYPKRAPKEQPPAEPDNKETEVNAPDPSSKGVATPIHPNYKNIKQACPFCGQEIAVHGLPRHIDWCAKNPDAKKPGDEVREPLRAKQAHTEDEYGNCPDCHKRMLKRSITWHRRAICPVVQYKAEQADVQTFPVENVPPATMEEIMTAPGPLMPGAPIRTPEPIGMPVNLYVDQPTPPVEDQLQDELYTILEMLVPNGIKPRLFPLVQEWLTLTEKLVRELRG